MNVICPCGSSQLYASCCGEFIDGNSLPATPEQLMRSRYTAFCIENFSYINKTMQLPNETIDNLPQQKINWQKLLVLNSSVNGTKGYVEFKAFYTVNNHSNVLHEKSEFHYVNRQWLYISGVAIKDTIISIGRNEACLCGSGKKYKKCCLI